MKISSARLKPEEASEMLQEDGDEARVGGVSVQIMAQVQQQQQQGENHDAKSPPHVAGNDRPSTRPLATAAVFKHSKLRTAGGGGVGGGGSTPGATRPAFKPLVSRLTPQPRQDGTSSTDGGIVLTPAPSKVADNLDASADSSAARAGGAVGGTGTRKVKSFRGVGGARRFQAPRSSGVAAAASPGITSPGVVGTSPLQASRVRSNAAVQHSSGLVRVVNRAPGDPPVTCVSGTSEKRSGSGDPTPDVRVDPGDLVLEWTTGNSPQPLRAGASLARRLHPHQREGLKVLWECLAGRGG